MDDVRLPNFLMIGAAKSGTTSLWRYLGQHPQIYFSPVKEPRFFSYEDETVNYRGPGDDKWGREIVSSWDSYRDLFRAAREETAIGEASNVYLYLAEKTAPRIAARLPGVKLMAILRHPVDRAYSSYMMLRGEGRETIRDFRRALHEESRRLADGWSPAWAYTRRGLYAESIRQYQRRFPPSRLKFFLYEDLAGSPQPLFDDIFAYLEVSPFAPDAGRKYNVSVSPKSRRLAYLLHNRTPLSRTLRLFVPQAVRLSVNRYLRDFNVRRPPKLPAELRDELTPLFREDILQTADLIDRDLTRWLGERARS